MHRPGKLERREAVEVLGGWVAGFCRELGEIVHEHSQGESSTKLIDHPDFGLNCNRMAVQ